MYNGLKHNLCDWFYTGRSPGIFTPNCHAWVVRPGFEAKSPVTEGMRQAVVLCLKKFHESFI